MLHVLMLIQLLGVVMAMGMDEFTPTEINGWEKVQQIETYDRESLFDYINGAAELYLSYDFRELLVLSFSKKDAPDITVELYRMNSSEDAFGIFSHDQEGEDIGIGQGSEYDAGWLRFWKGTYYGSIFTDEEDEETKSAVLDLGKAITEAIHPAGNKPKLLTYVPKVALKTARFFHTHEILNHHFFMANQNILKLNENTDAILTKFEIPGSDTGSGAMASYILLVQYPNAEQAQVASESFRDAYLPEAKQTGILRTENGKWAAEAVEKAYVIVVFDAPTRAQGQELIEKVKNNLPSPS